MGEVLGNQIRRASAMTRLQRIEEGLNDLLPDFDAEAPRRLAMYYEMLVDWNSRMNLTGDTDFDVVLDRHFWDSLAPLQQEALFPKDITLADVGSGAGFPGLPLAIVRQDLQVTLIDSLSKRIGFLNAVSKELGLCNVKTIHARAEDAGRLPECREGFDRVTARAVAPLPVLCELLLPFACVGGKVVAYKGPAAQEEEAAGNRVSVLLGGGKVSWIPVSIPNQPFWQHVVAVIEKKEKTASQYPRKAGTISRMPLGIPAKQEGQA